MTYQLKILIVINLIVFGFFNFFGVIAEEIIINTYQPSIEQKLNDLVVLDSFNDLLPEKKLKGIGKNKRVKFNIKNAEQRSKISKVSIRLKDQLSKYNSVIIDSASELDILTKDNLLNDFPELNNFFTQLENLRKDYKIDINNTSRINLTGTVDAVFMPYEVLARSNCGYFNNPKPSIGAPKPSSWHQDPEKTLLNWGYHRTAKYATGREYGIYDYTRNVTWNPFYCKWNSFRDHAGIDRDGNGNKTNILREQKYWGYTPNGECNPEIHSYVWPYPEWPAYCKWWHDRN